MDGTCPRTSGSAASGTVPAQSWPRGTEPGIVVQTRPVPQFTHRESCPRTGLAPEEAPLPPTTPGHGGACTAFHIAAAVPCPEHPQHTLPPAKPELIRGWGGSKGAEQSENQCFKARLAHIPCAALPQPLGRSAASHPRTGGWAIPALCSSYPGDGERHAEVLPSLQPEPPGRRPVQHHLIGLHLAHLCKMEEGVILTLCRTGTTRGAGEEGAQQDWAGGDRSHCQQELHPDRPTAWLGTHPTSISIS